LTQHLKESRKLMVNNSLRTLRNINTFEPCCRW